MGIQTAPTTGQKGAPTRGDPGESGQGGRLERAVGMVVKPRGGWGFSARLGRWPGRRADGIGGCFAVCTTATLIGRGMTPYPYVDHPAATDGEHDPPRPGRYRGRWVAGRSFCPGAACGMIAGLVLWLVGSGAAVGGIHDRQPLSFPASIGSMILGTVAAMAQQKVKRFVAYSSIGHVGYLCIGFAGGTTMEGIQSLLIGLLIYLFMTVNVFGLLCAVRPVRSQYLGDLGAFGKLHPLFAITFSLTMFSYAGIPPLAGFCSKFYLFFGAIRCGADVLAGLGVVTSVISCFYYLRLVKLMYFDLPGEYMIPPRLDRDNSIVLAITVACITLMFLYTSPLFLVTHYMAMGLFAESGVGFSGSVA